MLIVITKGCESNGGGGGVKLLEKFLVAAPRDVSCLLETPLCKPAIA